MSAASPILLYADLTNQKLRTDLGGSDFAWPKQMQRSKLRFRLRFSENIGGDTHVERFPKVREIRATVGQLDLRPETGQVSFQVGDATPVVGTNVTALLDHDFEAADLETALNALSNESDVVVVEDDDSFLITGLSASIRAYANTLRPISFARVHTYQVNNSTTRAVRLQRAPLAFTDQFTQRVPAGPSIERSEAGGSQDDIEWPEIQKLHTPREFAGSYRLLTDDEIQRSPLLGIGDGPEQVQLALNPSGGGIGLATDAGGVFTVTEHPTDPAMFIEFGGSMIGVAQDLLKVKVFDAPPGDFEIVLDLDTAATAEAFRDSNELKVPFEIFADFEDPTDDESVDTDIPIYSGILTIVESITHDDLGTASNQDFLEPPAAKTYLPVSPNSLSSGTRFHPFVLGDGTDTGPFAIPHNLNSPRTEIALRENKADGKSLVEGTDYSVIFNDDNQLTITLLGPYAATAPASNALTGTVKDLTLTSTWQQPLGMQIDDIEGLRAILDAHSAAIAAFQIVFPSNISRPASNQSRYSRKREMTPFGGIFPQIGRSVAVLTPGTRVVDFDQATLPRFAPSLFGAVHDTTVDDLPTTGTGANLAPALPLSNQRGGVFENVTASPLFLTSDGGGFELLPGQYAATDGEVWYPVEQYGSSASSSYYPAQQVRELWSETIEAEELLSGRQYRTQMAVGLAALRANAPVYCHLVIEIANLTETTTPGTPGPNLGDDVWVADPVFDQQLTLTAQPVEPVIGYRVTRDKNGDLTADFYQYGRWVSTTAPASARFAIRVRLVRWDTPATPERVSGFIAYSGPTFASGPVSQAGEEIGLSIVD